MQCEITVPRSVHINFKNLSNQAKLLSYGHTPVYLEVNNTDYQKLIRGELAFFRQKWKRIDGGISYSKGDEGLELQFHYDLKASFKKSDHIFFAYIYPYTYQDHLLSIKEV